MGIEAEGQLDYPKVQRWLNKLLQVGGAGGHAGLGDRHVPLHKEQ